MTSEQTAKTPTDLGWTQVHEGWWERDDRALKDEGVRGWSGGERVWSLWTNDHNELYLGDFTIEELAEFTTERWA